MDFGIPFNVSGYNSGGMSIPSGSGGMDPLVGLIGAGLSYLGGREQRASTENINQLNAAFAMQQAQGAHLGEYLGNLRVASEAAGYNPLATLGVKSPGTSLGMVGDTSGGGLSAAGAALSRMTPELDHMRLENQRETNNLLRSQGINAQIKNATDWFTLNELHRRGSSLNPPGWTDPAETSTWPGMVRKGLEGFDGSSLGVDPAKGKPVVPWHQWYDEMWNKWSAPGAWYRRE